MHDYIASKPISQPVIASQIAAALRYAKEDSRPSNQPHHIGQTVRARRCAGTITNPHHPSFGAEITYTIDGVVIAHGSGLPSGEPTDHAIIMDHRGDWHSCPFSWLELRNLTHDANDWHFLYLSALELE